MELSVIIPTMNRGHIFEMTLSYAIEAIKHIKSEIIIVNDSKDKPLIERKSGEVALRYVNNPKSGVASARNFGASFASYNVLLFLDDDILITKDSVDKTLCHYQCNENICINPDWVYPPALQKKLNGNAFGRFMIHHNLVSFKGWYNHDRWRDNDIFETPILASFHLAITRNNFVRSKGYDESFLHAGFEDYDYPIRLKNMGLIFFIDARVLVYHNEEDRIELKNWLTRQYRGAQTRRKAVELGYTELVIQYGFFKKLFLDVAYVFKPLLYAMLKIMSIFSFLDIISFKIILLLQAIGIYKGYFRQQ
jgi:glycosyltransferase involved in cell wall biosynthesis